MSMSIKTAPVLVLTLLALPVALIGEDDRDSPPQLETVTVTATRLSESLLEQPYALHRVDRSAIDEANTRTLTEALDREPGVIAQKTAPNQCSPFVRGLTGQQTLLLFDGVRLNNAYFRSGPNQYAALIPEEATERVDVILGSGATTMGADGLSGALDFRLAPAGRDAERGAVPHAETRYGTAEHGFRNSAGVDGRLGNWAYSVDGGYADVDELEGGKHAGNRLFGAAAGQTTIPNTSYSQHSLGARLGWRPSGGAALELALGRVAQEDAPRPDGYFQNTNNPLTVSRYYDPQIFDYLHVRYGGLRTGFLGDLQGTAWRHHQQETQVREDLTDASASGRYRRRVYDDATTTVGLDLQWKRAAGRHDLTYGLTAFRDGVACGYESFRSPAGSRNPGLATAYQTGAGNPEQTLVPDGSSYEGKAVFLQDSLRLSERWTLLPGLRYDRMDWEFPLNQNRAGYAGMGNQMLSNGTGAVSSSLRLAFLATGTTTAFAGVSQGFRSPTLFDLAGSQDRSSSVGPVITGNPGLESERALTFELGVKRQNGRDSASFSLFRTELTDLIETQLDDLDGDGRITVADSARRVNAADGFLQGFELAGDHGLPLAGHGSRLALVHAMSLVQGKAEMPQSGGGWREEYISRANQFYGRAGLRYEAARAWFALFQARWAAEYDHPAPAEASDARHTATGRGDGSMPGWAVFDLKAGWRRADGRLAVDLGLGNLLDATYRSVGSGTDGAGRNLSVGLKLRM